jgi:hypothetical protein
MTITASSLASISTANGNHTGTIRSCCEFQVEYQGSFASIDCGSAVSVDVSEIDFDADDIDAAIAAVIAAVEAD